MEKSLHCLLIKTGKIRHQFFGKLFFLIAGVFSCIVSQAFAIPPPPTILKAEETKKTERQFIPGLPLGPHTPDLKRFWIGVLDSGVDIGHPQLEGLIVDRKDFTGEGVGDSQGHGTLVTLRLVQSCYLVQNQLSKLEINENQDCLSKMSPIVVAKVVGKLPVSSQIIADRMVEAINWLANSSVSLVNVSIALPESDGDYTKLCDTIEKHSDIVFSVAAGNAGYASIVYPAACKSKNMMVVGALTEDGNLASYSGPADFLMPSSVSLESEAQYHRKHGDRLIKMQQWEDASKAYTEALHSNPQPLNKGLAEYGLGYITLQQGNKESALNFFKSSIDSFPKNPEAFVAMSVILSENQEHGKARVWLEKAFENDAVNIRVIDRYARVLLDLDKPSEAMIQIEKLLEIDPSNTEALQFRIIAQNWLNVLARIEQGTSPQDLAVAILNAGDDGRLIRFMLRNSTLTPNAKVGAQEFPLLVKATALNRYWSSIEIITAGADINGRDDTYKITPLMIASTKGFSKLVDRLIAEGAEIEMKDYLGFTALMFAAESGQSEIVTTLIENNANLLTTSLENLTALDYAKKYRHRKTIAILQSAISKIKQENDRP